MNKNRWNEYVRSGSVDEIEDVGDVGGDEDSALGAGDGVLFKEPSEEPEEDT